MRLAAIEIKIIYQIVRELEGASLTIDCLLWEEGREKVRKIKFQGFEIEHDFGTINRNIEVISRKWWMHFG